MARPGPQGEASRKPWEQGTFWAQIGSKSNSACGPRTGWCHLRGGKRVEEKMDSIIYLVGLIVVVMAILSFFGLH
jgi:hypothetical protein